MLGRMIQKINKKSFFELFLYIFFPLLCWLKWKSLQQFGIVCHDFFLHAIICELNAIRVFFEINHCIVWKKKVHH